MSREPEARTIAFDRDDFFRVFLLVIGAWMAGYLWNVRPTMSPNDAARWDTIWSLVEYGDYQIYDTPEEAEKWGRDPQFGTIDKVMKDGRTYASKPPLLPTVIAGWVKLVQFVVREPFSRDRSVPGAPTVPGSIHIYGKATLFLFNLVPFLAFLVVYRRWLDRFTTDPFSWTYCLLAAALGTLTTGYLSTLNNHTQAAYAAFFTAYLVFEIWQEKKLEGWRFALAGLFAGWTAANEFPAGIFVLLALAAVFQADGKRTVLFFLPPLAVVTAALLLTNYLAIGSLIPAYLQKDLYDYPGSYWLPTSDKSGIDALNENPESYLVYFLHLSIGHHGLFSLTPLWLLAAAGFYRSASGEDRRLTKFAWGILGVSAVVFYFYWILNDQRNYGGFCHGARWLMWLSPLWLMLLPVGTEPLAHSRRGRAFAWGLLAISIVSMADTLYNPWTRSWLHRILLWFGVIGY